MTRHLTLKELEAGLAAIQKSPRERGTVRAIVIRPTSNERASLHQCDFSFEGGAEGDRWALGCWKTLPDGSPHPDVQVAMMNSRAIALIAETPERWPLAGDNLFVDFDLSTENLPVGQRLAIGSAVLEITKIAHNGCHKFAERFGKDAKKFVNSPQGKRLHLRGIYARIIENGTITIGDKIRKLRE